jgi:predicted AlkP superfamily pyrophosphatase or phosphodiesterase
MRIPIAISTVFGFGLLVAGPAAGPVPAKDRTVVMVSLDGFPAFDLEDPAMPIPTLRSLVSNGVSARMGTVNPTVTWPNHTTLVTGVRPDEHGLLVNGTLAATGTWPPVKIDPMIEKTKMVLARTVYDAAHEAGLTTGQVDWVAINKAPTIRWAFTEWGDPAGVVEQEMIRASAVSAADVQAFTKLNILYRDQVWAKAAAHIIRQHKPNLLLVHFLSLDSTHHTYGPKTLAATSAVAFLDGCVAQIVAAIREAGMADRATVFIVADHGFKRYTKEIHAAVALNAAGLAGKTHLLNEGGSALVYVQKSQRDELLLTAIKALEAIEGVDKVIGRDGFPAGLPTPEDDPQMSDLFVTAKAGYSFAGAIGGPVTAAAAQIGGSHGYIASDPDMDGLFIASGYGIAVGTKLERIANVDVAPTIARLLGVSMPSARGTTLPILKP